MTTALTGTAPPDGRTAPPDGRGSRPRIPTRRTGARPDRRTLAARAAPAVVAGVLGAVYVLVSPPSADLAAHLFRAQLFREEGFGIWNNLWYSGHDIVGYSVLFPAVSAVLSPQLAAALAAVATAALFEPLARRHLGSRALPGAVLFGAATAIDLYTGRLAFAFGALPALAAVVALDRGATGRACAAGTVSALCSPVAALFAALAGLGYALGGERRVGAAAPGAAVAVASLAPVAVLAIAFPEGGTEPFGPATLVPLLALAALALATAPRDAVTLRAGVVVYAVAAVAVYVVPSPVGSNIARLGTLVAAPLAALLWWRRRDRLLVIALLPLLYLGWQAPIRDVWGASGDPSTSAAYYGPLLRFLGRQGGAPFRIEIPFTRSHWEAYVVATRFPIARGWDRQLDAADNPLFYDGRLTARSYDAWLHRSAVRFVALPDAALDYSAAREAALIRGGLGYLRVVMRSAHWTVYAVTDPTPIAVGVATLRAVAPDSLTLFARSAGSVLVHVHFTPYWALAQGSGCVAAAGPDTRLTLRRSGTVTLVTRFALSRIGATSPRCR